MLKTIDENQDENVLIERLFCDYLLNGTDEIIFVITGNNVLKVNQGFYNILGVDKFSDKVSDLESYFPNSDILFQKIRKGLQIPKQIKFQNSQKAKFYANHDYFSFSNVELFRFYNIVKAVNEGKIEIYSPNEYNYKILFESANDAIFLFKKDRMLDCNQKSLEMFEMEKKDFLSVLPYELSPPFQPDNCTSIEKAQEKIKLVLSGKPQRFEWIHQKSNSNLFYAEVCLNLVQFDKFNCIQAIVRDITKRKKAELLLLEQERQFRSLFESSPIMIHILSSKGVIKQSNPIAFQTLGYKETEFIGSSLVDFIPPDKRREFQLFIRDVQKHRLMSGISYIYNKEGQSLAVENSASLIVDKKNPGGIIVVFQKNITERLVIERKLEQHVHHLEKLVNKRTQEVERTNRTLQKEIKERKEIEGQLIKYRDHLENILEEHSQELIKTNIDLEIEMKERRKIDEALAESEKRYRSLIENLPVALYRTSFENNGRFLMINPAFVKLFEYESELEVMDLSVDSLYWDSSSREYLMQKLIIQEKLEDEEIQFKTKNNKKFWGNINSTLITDEITREKYIDGIILDITHEKMAIEEKDKIEAQLRQSQKMESIGRLAGGIAHDFNNLLMVISGYVEFMLSNYNFSEECKKDLEEIYNAGKTASSLTSQLLAFSRKQMLNPEIADMNEIISDLKSMINRLVGEDVRIESDLADVLNLVEVDTGQMQQIIMNLAVNARDAMPQGGKLYFKSENVIIDKYYCEMLSYAREGSFICVTIRDTGSGISQEIIQNIFEPFFTTKEKGKGTGLGLSVVYGIIKQHEGWVNVFSKIGKGTAFKIYLPVVKDSAIKNHQELVSLKQNHFGLGQKILYVEDEVGVSNLLIKALKQYGFSVYPMSLAQEALDAFKANSEFFDMLFSDVVLPDFSGVILADLLREMNPDLKVILTSGYADHKSEFDKIKEKGYEFIAKPYSLEALLSKIDNFFK